MQRHIFLCRLRQLAAYALIAVLLCGPVGACAKQASGSRSLQKRGRKYEKKKDYANAYLYYSKAAAADPAKKEYWQRAQALQRRAIEDANVLPAAASKKRQTLSRYRKSRCRSRSARCKGIAASSASGGAGGRRRNQRFRY